MEEVLQNSPPEANESIGCQRLSLDSISSCLNDMRVLGALAKLVKRRTIRPEWTTAGLAIVAEIRHQQTKEGKTS